MILINDNKKAPARVSMFGGTIRDQRLPQLALRTTPTLGNMLNVIYRVMERGPERFIVEAFTIDHGAWRCIDEYPTLKEANARKARLEQILRTSRGKLG